HAGPAPAHGDDLARAGHRGSGHLTPRVSGPVTQVRDGGSPSVKRTWNDSSVMRQPAGVLRAAPRVSVPARNRADRSPPGWWTCVVSTLARNTARSPSTATTGGEPRCWVRANAAREARCHSASPAHP